MAMRLLRLCCLAHRFAAGVARPDTHVMLQPLLAECRRLLAAPPRGEGALDLLPLGGSPLSLAMMPSPSPVAAAPPPRLLVPNRAVAWDCSGSCSGAATR